MPTSITKALVVGILLFLPSALYAAPFLAFSDITSGPKTGNTDGVGSGTIVTIWGQGLGSTQGTSKVYVGNVEATAVYYWKDADGTLPGGPSDLKTYHKMQEIAFAIPATAADGVNTIKVVTNGETSNTLPFTVRAGNVRYIKPSPDGNDATGNGSWQAPWATLQGVMDGSGKLSAGDIVYSVGVGTTSGMNVGVNGRMLGTEALPFALIAYPNTNVALSGHNYAGYVIFNYNNQEDDLASEYVHFSKLKITCAQANDSSSGVRAFKGNRIVGVEITGPTVFYGVSGAIGGNRQAASGGKYFGLYIHHYGTANGVQTIGNTHNSSPSTCGTEGQPACTWDILQHLIYLSVRSATTNEAYEIAYGNLIDNPIMQGIHVYDMTTSGSWTGTMKFHHNVLRNQRYHAINVDLADADYAVATPFEIHDNLIISDVGDPYNYRAINLKARVTNRSVFKIYNNTIYGYNDPVLVQVYSSEFRNNIVYDTKNKGYLHYEPNTHSNNLYFGGPALTSWLASEVGKVNANPLFTNVAGYDFSLSGTSPALDVGYNTAAVAPIDFLGAARGAAPSIGAFGAGIGTPEPTTSTPRVYCPMRSSVR